MRHALLTLALLAGCGDPEDEFRAALPPRDGLLIAMPGLEEGQGDTRRDSLVGQVAEFYAVTRRTSEQFNGMVGGVLGTIWRIADAPPSALGPDSAVWGPFTPVLSPVTFRLVVARAGERMAFHLDARPKSAADDAFRPFVSGGPTPGAPQGQAAGEFALDLSLMHRLDPVGQPAEGALAARFQVGPAGASIRVHLDGVHGPGEPALTAGYAYEQAPDGAGDFQFAVDARLLVRSRWQPSGAGRADAHVRDGGAGVDASECWDAGFARVFFAAQPLGGQSGSEGDPSACAFAEALAPEL